MGQKLTAGLGKAGHSRYYCSQRSEGFTHGMVGLRRSKSQNYHAFFITPFSPNHCKLIIGANNKDYKPDFELIEKSLPHFFAYNVVLLVVAITVGNLARKLVEQFNLDISIYSLRYNNDWYYLLSGRILNFPQWETAANQVESVYADVLVETKEGSVLYCGLLDEFYLSKDGLDRICLSEVYRRKFTEDVKDDQRPEDKLFDNRYYRMPGDLFVIPYSQIRNLNLTYYGPVQVDEISAEAA